MAEGLSDKRLVQGFLKGNRTATNHIERLITGAAFRWQHRIGPHIDDVVSDTRFRLYVIAKENRFRFDCPLSQYIRIMVDHAAIDFRKKMDVRSYDQIDETNLSNPGLNPEQQAIADQAGWLRYRVLRQVDPFCIKLWRMRLHEGLSHREIGQREGKSEGNIRRRIWACREEAKFIREKLEKGANI